MHTKLIKHFFKFLDLKNTYPIYIFIGIILFSILYFAFTNDSLLIYYGDSYEQQLAFYIGGWEKFHSFDFSLWDWSLGLGSNYLSTVFYYATSPFFFISLLLPKAWIPQSILYLNALKLFILMLGSYLWLKEVTSHQLSSTLGAIILALSGWVSFFFHYNHFLDAFIFYPFLLFLIDGYIKNKRFKLMVFTLGALGIVNFYFLYMFIPFSILYFTLRLTLLHKLNFKAYVIEILKFLGIGLIGIGVSGIILLPSMYIVLNAPRLKTLAQINWFQTISIYDTFRYISSIFSPVMERFDPSYYLSVDQYQGLGWAGGVSLYTSFLFPMMLILNFIDAFRNKKFHVLTMYSILLFMSSFLIFYKLLQGSLDVRWYFMFTFINVYILVTTLHQHITTSFKQRDILVSIFIPLLAVIGLLCISLYKKWYGDEGHLQLLLSVSLYASLFITFYGFLIYFRKFKTLTFLIILEVIISFSIPLLIDGPMTASEYKLIDLTKNSTIDYLQSTDKGFYRILNDTSIYSTPNDPKAKYYRGLSFYASLYNFEQEDYLSRLKGDWLMPVNFGRTYTYLLLNVKYYISTDNNHPAPFGFVFLEQYGADTIFINRYFYDLGYASTQTFNQDAFKRLSFLNQDRLLMDHVITESSINTMPKYFNQLNTIASWTDPINLTIQDFPITPFNIYVETFDIPVVRINTYSNQSVLNSKLLTSSYYWQYNYCGQYISNTSTLSAIEIQPKNLYQSESKINIYLETDLDAYDVWYEQLKSNSFTNVSIKNDQISADILVTESNSWISTSIPYDIGWKVIVDGKEIVFEKVNLGFIGFQLEEGFHQIQFTYLSPYLKEGILLTLFSILLVFLVSIFKNRKDLS